ncbi:MAG: hypothetical protein METHSR3v1_230001, partial [Methanothrix sp.]
MGGCSPISGGRIVSQTISDTMSRKRIADIADQPMGTAMNQAAVRNETNSQPLTLTVQGGVDKCGHQDLVHEIEISRGEIIGIV